MRAVANRVQAPSKGAAVSQVAALLLRGNMGPTLLDLTLQEKREMSDFYVKIFQYFIYSVNYNTLKYCGRQSEHVFDQNWLFVCNPCFHL